MRVLSSTLSSGNVLHTSRHTNLMIHLCFMATVLLPSACSRRTAEHLFVMHCEKSPTLRGLRGLYSAACFMQSYFSILDDEVHIRILAHLGTTVCLGTAPERRAALLPIKTLHNNTDANRQALQLAPEISVELVNPAVSESSSVLLHTPQLQADATEANVRTSGAEQSASRR